MVCRGDFAWRTALGVMNRLRVLKSHVTCPMLRNSSKSKLDSDVSVKLQSFHVRLDVTWSATARGNACQRDFGRAAIQHANVS